MRIKFIGLTAATLILVQGCASGFRAGGRRAGVEAGAAVGPSPVVLPPAPAPYAVPPAPVEQSTTAYPTHGRGNR